MRTTLTLRAVVMFAACLTIASERTTQAQTLQRSSAIPSHIAKADSHYPFGMVAVGTTLYAMSDVSSDLGFVALSWSNNNGTESISKSDLTAPDEHVSKGPALAAHGGNIYTVFREESSSGSDKPYYFSTYANSSWSDPQKIQKMSGGTKNKKPGLARGESDHTPALAVSGSTLFVIDKNNTKHFIAECWYDVNSQTWTSNDNTTNYASKDSDKDPRQDNDFGYQDTYTGSHGDDYQNNQIQTTGSDGPWNPQTPRTPAAATLPDGNVLVAYKGGRYADDSKAESLFQMTRTTSNGTWSKPVQIGDFQSKFGPAITVYGGSTLLVFSNSEDHDRLYWSKQTNGGWSTPALLFPKPSSSGADVPDGSGGSPVLAPFTSAGHIALSYRRNSDHDSVIYLLDYK